MLKFRLDDTECENTDDYYIQCEGTHSDDIKSLWEFILSETSPASPCPIDEMYANVLELGAEIIKYEEEFNPELVY